MINRILYAVIENRSERILSSAIVESTRIHSMRQRIEPSSQFPELISSNFDPYERKRHLPVQMSLFNYSQEEEPYEI